MPKYLFTFEKSEAIRWLGHLDILRTIERAIRRAALPIAFSSGFNPRERLAFASALSVGVTGAAEPATMELTEEIAPDEIISRLNSVLPPGLQLRSCVAIPDAGSRDLLNSFTRAEYEVVCNCPEEIEITTVQAAIESLLSKSSLITQREREGRTKTLDIRPYIVALHCNTDRPAPNRILLHTELALGESGNARPQEVVTALSEFLPNLQLRRSHRVRLIAPETKVSEEG